MSNLIVKVPVIQAVFFILALSASHSIAEEKDESKEKLVTFYPTYGYLANSAGTDWHIPFRFWISEDLDPARKLSLNAARKIIEQKIGIDDLTQAQKTIFKSRAQDFLRDSESGEQVKILF
ncbi:MAG: hypothetical protein OQJ89_11305, partial [Kangiellaceae bacterium]|nr:hypothetical protein [Kangiellaceae bacterium]